jgi:ribonuclease D
LSTQRAFRFSKKIFALSLERWRSILSSDPNLESTILVERPAFRVITDMEEARTALQLFEQETLIGLDTETFWDVTANRSRVSLVQLAAAASGEIIVIDLLAINAETLRTVIDSPSVTMAAHNARFDEGMLVGEGLRPTAFVDTLRLARKALRLPSYSLAGVCAHLFGIELDKSYQKSNWRRRPLTRAQLEYAAKDAYLSLHVYLELKRILEDQGQLEEALRAATLSPVFERMNEPRQRRKPPPVPPRPLTEEEKEILQHLKRWRLEKSRGERVAAYMICPDRTLEHLAMELPQTLEALNSIHGLGPSRTKSFGEELLKEILRILDRRREE